MNRFLSFFLPLLIALGLLFVIAANWSGCSHLGPPLPNDPTQPPFPIKPNPCAGQLDPNCFPWPQAHRPDAGADR